MVSIPAYLGGQLEMLFPFHITVIGDTGKKCCIGPLERRSQDFNSGKGMGGGGGSITARTDGCSLQTLFCVEVLKC